MNKIFSEIKTNHLSFNIFIDAVSKVIQPRRILLFADDAKLFHNIITMDDCIVLQTVLFKLVNWCETVGLSLNLDKCARL